MRSGNPIANRGPNTVTVNGDVTLMLLKVLLNADIRAAHYFIST